MQSIAGVNRPIKLMAMPDLSHVHAKLYSFTHDPDEQTTVIVVWTLWPDWGATADWDLCHALHQYGATAGKKAIAAINS
jgi:hypothetical protein